MKITHLTIRSFFKLASFLAPSIAGNIAFNLFQTTKRKVRKKEEEFFKNARHFQVPDKKENIDCYELGSRNGEIVFLIHGWDSNAGSMSAIATELASLNYRVITFNFPGHGTSRLTKANLLVCSYAFLNVLRYVKPRGKFSIVAHSFGSAVTAFTLSKVSYPLNKIIFLTTPNYLTSIFEEFRQIIGLGSTAFKVFIKMADTLLGEDSRSIAVEDKMKSVSFSEFLILHDLFDKVLAHKSSLDVHNAIPGSRLVTTLGVGHYGMLWDEKVLNQINEYFSDSGVKLPKAS